MKVLKMISIVFTLLLFATFSSAADITLAWDPVVGATGYKLYASYDVGATWILFDDAGNVTERAITGVPEDVLVLFRASAYNTNGETVRVEAGVWYDHRLLPLSAPSGTGIQ